MGQTIINQSLVFFFLTLPDFWFSPEEDPSKRNIFHIMKEKPEIGRKAIALRSFATQILDMIGKREVHVVTVIPGGIINPLKEKEREILLKASENACKITREAIELGKELFEKNWLEFRKAGDYKTNYMALTNNGSMEFYEGKVKAINPEGETLSEFDSQQYMEHIEEKRLEWTYAKFAYLKALGWPNGIVQVGSTPRINVNKSAPTECANEELKEFKRKFGDPAHATLLFDYARLIDLMYACERAKEILEDKSLTRENVRVKVKSKQGRGVGIVEAPRGTLAHEYLLTRYGRLKSLKLIIPTQINNAAININVKDAAAEFIQKGEIKPGLLNRIEMVVRAYDPCIKCAARSVGEHLCVEIRNADGKLLKALSS